LLNNLSEICDEPLPASSGRLALLSGVFTVARQGGGNGDGGRASFLTLGRPGVVATLAGLSDFGLTGRRRAADDARFPWTSQ